MKTGVSGRGPLQRAIRRPHIASPQSAISSPLLGVAAPSTYSSLILAGTTPSCWWHLRCWYRDSSVVTVCCSSSGFSRCMRFSVLSSCIRLFLFILLVACLLSAPELPALWPGSHILTPVLPLAAAAPSPDVPPNPSTAAGLALTAVTTAFVVSTAAARSSGSAVAASAPAAPCTAASDE